MIYSMYRWTVQRTALAEHESALAKLGEHIQASHPARAAGRIRIDGSSELASAFPSWGGLSYFANIAPARSG